MNYFDEIENAVTVCDAQGKIVYMNQKSIETFVNYGGEKLLGSNLLECHPEPSRTKLKNLLETHETNTYTIEKNGRKKLIHQIPWFEKGIFNGFIEISIPLPEDMPLFLRK